MKADSNSIFLSYRRGDVPDAVDRIADLLRDRFSSAAVFVDIEDIAAGDSWREALERALEACEVLLVIIGPRWLRQASDAENLALDDPDDFVRYEIATALARDISIIPVLCGGAKIPSLDQLPPDVRGLEKLQAFSLRRGNFELDGRLLLERVEARVRMFASLGRRLFAFVIDLFPALAVTAAIGAGVWTFWVLLVAYHWLLVGATGRTLGKLLMGTRVDSSQPPLVRWIFALARPLLGYPVVLFTVIGAIQLVLHPQHVAIHDRLFRSNVLQVRRRPLAAGLGRIDGASYSFDEWLLKLFAGIGMWFPIDLSMSFLRIDRPEQWVRDTLERLWRPESRESSADPVEGAESFAGAAEPTTGASPGVANPAVGGATAGMQTGAGIVGAGALLVAAPPLIVGLALAAVSMAIFQGVAGPILTSGPPAGPILPGSARLSGEVRNAVDNAPVPDATVNLLEGPNSNATDAPRSLTSTDENGAFVFEAVPPGEYTLVTSRNGFVDGIETSVRLRPGDSVMRLVALSPLQPGGQMRIVLTWGSEPSDLDSHITGFNGAAEGFHLYYEVKGSATEHPFATLDFDVTSGNGPETVTIHRQIDASYCYSVHDFSNRFSETSSSALRNSGARVDVYQESSLRTSFRVPGSNGTLWTVFRITEGEIVPINSVSSGLPPGTCG